MDCPRRSAFGPTAHQLRPQPLVVTSALHPLHSVRSSRPLLSRADRCRHSQASRWGYFGLHSEAVAPSASQRHSEARNHIRRSNSEANFPPLRHSPVAKHCESILFQYSSPAPAEVVVLPQTTHPSRIQVPITPSAQNWSAPVSTASCDAFARVRPLPTPLCACRKHSSGRASFFPSQSRSHLETDAPARTPRSPSG